ncbi:SGNH/GDSL hydrolase family protein [Leifsonia sp. 2TAF2]|uniref:SGNH/GDSL hydrolase family protein n=1 Tax=Leifsonia sp. 2TAF2 TaxID=3233009 RepID=UPI003F9462EE
MATAFAAVALVAGGVVAAAPSSALSSGQLTGSYVALGDSYASGNGAGAYIESSGECYRSTNAYWSVWSRAYPTLASASFACGGATTENVLTAGGPPAQVNAALSTATKVTLTVGGNDVGFTNAITTCVFGADAECTNYLQNTVTPAIGALSAKLDSLYTTLKARAPHAAVEIVGYPRLMEETGSADCGWSVTKRQALNTMADRLSDTITARASAAGFTYRDVRKDFSGHGVCSTTPWINNVGEGVPSGWMHINAAGHARIAALLTAPKLPAQVSASNGRLTVSLTPFLYASATRVMFWVNGAYVGETYRGSSYYSGVDITPTAINVFPGVTVKTGDRVQVAIVPGTPGTQPTTPSSDPVYQLVDTQIDSVYGATLTGDGRVAVHLATALFRSSGAVTVTVNGAYRGSTSFGSAYYMEGYVGGDGAHLTTLDGGAVHGDHVTVTLGSQPIYDGVL